MPDVDGTCEYVLDPDDPETWGGEEGDECDVDEEILNEEGVWPCPHDVKKGEDMCLFHLPIEEKDEEEVVDEFVEVIETTSSDDRRSRLRLSFLSAKFGRFELVDQNLSIQTDDLKIDLSYAEIESIDWTDTIFDVGYFQLHGAEFKNEVEFERTSFEGDINFSDARFGGKASFLMTEFGGDTSFSGVTFGGFTSFMSAKFEYDAYFGEANFRASALFRGTAFGDMAYFETARFFDTVVFSDATIEQSDFTSVEFNSDANFNDSEFFQDTDFGHAEFHGELDFSGVAFGGDADFNMADFHRRVDFGGIRVSGDVSFGAGIFDRRTVFSGMECTGRVSFSGSEFNGDALFANVNLGSTDFMDSVFDGEVNFVGAHFSSVLFSRTEFGGESEFSRGEFDGYTSFSDATFCEDTKFKETKFRGDTEFDGVVVGGKADFSNAEFDGDAKFDDAEFRGDAKFENIVFNEGAMVRGVPLGGCIFRGSDLSDVIFTGAALVDGDFESALLNRATLFEADLRGAKLSGALLGDVRIDDETKFLGHPSDDSDSSPHTFSTIRSRQTCVYDPDYEEDNEHADVDKAKSVYRALEELGGKHARPRLQARSFVRRQDLQKDEYKQDAKEAESWEERLIAGARWSRAKMARATLLYGESPWRVIGWSLSIILGFALLFPLGGWMKPEGGEPISYAQISTGEGIAEAVGGFFSILGDSVYYSTLTFTALGFGDFNPVGFGRALTTIETGLGAVLLALLVFILGRRAAR